MTFICRSSYTGIVISIEDYLKIYLNETPIIGYTANVYSKDIFILTIKDKFDNELWNGSITYSRTITKSVDMRVFTFTNRETQITTMTILQSGSSGHLFYPLPMLGSVPVYLKDGSYSVDHKPTNPEKEDGVMWVANSYEFDCSLAVNKMDLWLGTFENIPPAFNFMGSLEEFLTNNRNIILTVAGFQALNFMVVLAVALMIANRIPKKEKEKK